MPPFALRRPGIFRTLINGYVTGYNCCIKQSAQSAAEKDSMSKNKTALASKLYKEMLLYRRMEERINAAYMAQKFSGFCHLHIGAGGSLCRSAKRSTRIGLC